MTQAALVTAQLGNGRSLSSQASEANAICTMTLPAGQTGTRIRLFKLIASTTVAAAATMILTFKPDNSTSVVTDTGTSVGVVADFNFMDPVIGKEGTAFVITLGAAGNSTVTHLLAEYDYNG